MVSKISGPKSLFKVEDSRISLPPSEDHGAGVWFGEQFTKVPYVVTDRKLDAHHGWNHIRLGRFIRYRHSGLIA